MESGTTATAALDSIEDILDRFDAVAVARDERLGCAQRAHGLASRLTAVAALLLARADAAQESMRESGTPTSSWLTTRAGLSKREAAGLLHRAHDLAEHPEVARAAVDGRISVDKARAIGTVLGGLDGLDQAQQAQAEELLLGLAADLDTDRLAKAAPEVLAAVAPARAAESLERRLQRQAEAAHRNRALVFGREATVR